jgi:hypothetical protein
MKTLSNHKKIKALEEDIQVVESIIFNSRPELKESPVYFERNKIVKIKGVNITIDLFAQIKNENSNNPVFIFESRNFGKIIEKDNIIQFTEKIKKVKAVKGFFVGKEFTDDATEIAEQNPKIELLKLKNNINFKPFPIGVFATIISPVEVSLDPNPVQSIDTQVDLINLDGKELPFDDFIVQLGNELAKKIRNSEPHLFQKEHSFKRVTENFYPENKFSVKGEPFQSIKSKFQFTIKKNKPNVLSEYNKETQNRTYSSLWNFPYYSNRDLRPTNDEDFLFL